MCDIAVQQEPGRAADTTILRVAGPLTLATLFDFEDAAGKAKSQHLIIDLSRASYLDSAGLGAILSCWAHGQRNGRKFAITGVPDRIAKLLEITKTNNVLPQYKTVEDAEKAFL